MWRGGLGGAYLFPTLSSVGASLALPCFRFHTPLIEPDVRMGATTTEVASSHVVMLSQPQVVIDVIRKAVKGA